jgi:hypothetical protein
LFDLHWILHEVLEFGVHYDELWGIVFNQG